MRELAPPVSARKIPFPGPQDGEAEAGPSFEDDKEDSRRA
jgi:hypothetical protein